MSDFIENPFISKMIMFHCKDDGDTIELDMMNVSKYYKDVYFLVKKNNTIIPPEFYSKMIPKEIFDTVSHDLILYKASVKVLKNKKHFDNMILIDPSFIKNYNIFNYNLGNKMIILVPVLNIEYMNLIKYLEQYESSNSLENVYKMMVLNNYFDVKSDNIISTKYICDMITNMKDSQWWSHDHNCFVDFNNIFKDHRFSCQSYYLRDRKVADIIKKIFSKKIIKTSDSRIKNSMKKTNQKYSNTTDDNYIEDLIRMQNNMNSNHRIGSTSEFSKDDINKLFDSMNEKHQFYLYANLMISPKHCHLVVCNAYVMKKMRPVELKFGPLFRYLKSYAFIELYRKERARKFHKITDEDIFSINDASELIQYPFNNTKPKENPYMPILVADSLLKPNTNFHSDIRGQGICNMIEFKTCMNIFTTRNPDKDLFEGYDFQKHNACVTGSIMSACMQKSSSLLTRFNAKNNTELYNNYFDEYFCKSDIDIMIKTKNNMEFIDSTNELYNTIVLNLVKSDPSINIDHIKLKLNKVGYLFVTEDFIKKNIHKDDIIDQDLIPYIEENINMDHVKALFEPFYKTIASEQLAQATDSDLMKKYPDLYTIENVDFKIYINRHKKNPEFIDNIQDKDISLVFTYKYNINSPYLIHPLEIFPSKYDDFFQLVSNFHLPCVRAYYDGNDVYMTTSCVIAHMTNMNIDSKYFTGTKDLFDIILKNMMRLGMGLWMNQNDKQIVTEYCKNIPFWSNLYTISPDETSETSMSIVFGSKNVNHKMFRPRFYNMDDYTDCCYVDTNNRYNNSIVPMTETNVSTTLAIISAFKSVDISINYDNFKAIDSNGFVVPVKKWLIEMTWEMASMNGNKKK